MGIHIWDIPNPVLSSKFYRIRNRLASKDLKSKYTSRIEMQIARRGNNQKAQVRVTSPLLAKKRDTVYLISKPL